MIEEAKSTVQEAVKKGPDFATYTAGYGGTYDHVTPDQGFYGGWQVGGGPTNIGPTETEIRLRESAIALTVEFYKNKDNVTLPDFDTQLNKFYAFLQTGAIPAPVNF